MIDLKLIEKQDQNLLDSLKKRGLDLNSLLDLKKELVLKKELIKKIEVINRDRNIFSREIPEFLKNNKIEEASYKKKLVKQAKEELTILEEKLVETNLKIEKEIFCVPNILDESVHYGMDDSDNLELRKWGLKKDFKNPKEHHEILNNLGILDQKLGVKIAGSRFNSYNNKLSKIQRALVNYCLDENSKVGYEEYWLPFLAKPKMLYGTGQLPKFKDDAYYIEGENLFLIPTGEVTLTNIFSNTIIEKNTLPYRVTTYSPCFRKESGSAGKDVKGLIRTHQFNKVEVVSFVSEEDSALELERMVAHVESLLQGLNLPYRVVKLCSGDTGFSSALTFDIELWMPGQNQYREVSSCSNCKDFQSRRMNSKYRTENGEKKYIHTLNGSALAIDRVIAAIVENYQTDDGNFLIPEILKKYL